MGDVIRARGLFTSGLAMAFRFSLLFLIKDVEKLSSWQSAVATGFEWLTTIMLLAGVILALIDDLNYGTFTHLAHLIIMIVVLNASLVLMVNVSRAAMFGIIALLFVLVAVEMSLGAPLTIFVSAVLSYLGFLTPIILLIIAIGSILGLSAVF